MEVFSHFLLVILSILLVFQSIEPLENRSFGGCLFIARLVDLGMEGAYVLLRVQIIFEGAALLCHLACELVLLL